MLRPPTGWTPAALLCKDWLKERCTSVGNCKQLHALLLRTGLLSDNHSVSKLLSFLTHPAAGHLGYARSLFSQLGRPDSFIWNTMIRGHARGPDPHQALSFFRLMVGSGVAPEHHTYPFVLAACSRLRAVELGMRFHGEAVKVGLEADLYVINSLVQMYADCGNLDSARRVFDGSPARDVVTWNAMIGGYVHGARYDLAFRLFEVMLQEGGVEADEVTFLSLVSACAKMGDPNRGKWFHSFVKELGLDTGNLHLGNALIDMYYKCGDMESASLVFDNMTERDVLSWTSMISGLAGNGCFREALRLFGQMQREKIRPDKVVLGVVLSICAQTGALDQGKYAHLLMERYEVKCDVVLETALVDMYAKCGGIDLAMQIFNNMRERNLFTWNAMIGGLAMHGHGRHALELFHKMKDENVIPDDVTFISVLSACNHAGFVDEGLQYFTIMKEEYHIQPRMEHYGCIIDMLCRTRRVNDALGFMENMPIRPTAILWASLMGACRASGDMVLAERVAKCAIELEPDSCGRYIMLSNLYARTRRWDDATEVRNLMKAKGVEKNPGVSWIEVSGLVHQFVAGDNSHLQTDRIYMMVEEMCLRLGLAGHVTGTSEVSFDIEEEEKEQSLFFHSEKLAVAYGLLTSAPGSSIRIVKNLRVCVDCHSFLKGVSKVFGREIIARDRSRFHHFRGGACSCFDFW
uniref:Pentatricopeptide repeat-containing protein At1g08070 n=1 Tax=Anthurium amnicola TaxID=1678845 RepID=A0A1D1YU43_9ARAE